jgi:hypothetical protein
VPVVIEPKPYCPCGGTCHHDGDAPCSLSCLDPVIQDLGRLREALADARETIIAHYVEQAFSPRTRPSVVRGQVREIDQLLGRPPTNFDALRAANTEPSL